MASRFLNVKRPGTCVTCRAAIAVDDRAYWDAARKTLECALCCPEALDVDQAGASARREGQRRATNREQRIRDAHPRLGGLIHALTEPPQTVKAWTKGATGEELLGVRLGALRETGAVVLHDRRIPGTRANIDHIVVVPSGVWIIDAKRYKGLVASRDVGSLFRPDVRLYVGSRDRSSLVAGMARQVQSAMSSVTRSWSSRR